MPFLRLQAGILPPFYGTQRRVLNPELLRMLYEELMNILFTGVKP
ncbi:MAG: hypothetical protein WA828_05705 [Coleofasciculaceae cyanobacterium]